MWLLVLSFTLSQMALRSFVGVFWAIPPQLLGGTAAAAGIALINSIGNLGGFVGPAIIGALHDLTGGYTGGLLALTAALVDRGGADSCMRCRPSPTPCSAGRSPHSGRVDVGKWMPDRMPRGGPRPRRTTMGLTSDSFQSIRFSSPQRLLEVDRLMELAAVGRRRGRAWRDDADRFRVGATHATDEGRARHVRRGPDVLAARGPRRVRARGAQSRRRRARPACASSACSAAATRCSTRWRTGRRPSPAFTSRSRRPSRLSSSTGCRSASRTTRTGGSISRSRCCRQLQQRVPRRDPRYRQQPGGPRRSDGGRRNARAVHVQRPLQGHGARGVRARGSCCPKSRSARACSTSSGWSDIISAPGRTCTSRSR